MLVSTSTCTLALPSTVRLIVVCGVEIDGAERIEDLQLLTVGDVLRKSRGYRLFLGFVTTDPARFFNQTVVDSKIGRHGYTPQCVSNSVALLAARACWRI